jgi:hypothetical protein
MSLLDNSNMVGNYEERKVAKDVLENGLVVSTAYTTDEGYETAIINTLGDVKPVQRYPSKEAANVGHAKWVTFAADGIGKTITVLGCWEDSWETLKEELK